MSAGDSLKDLMRAAEELTASARRAIKCAEEGDTDIFLQHAAAYLGDFEPWASQMQELNPLGPDSELDEQQKAEVKVLVQALSEAHCAVIEAAEVRKEQVGEQMGSMHKKAKAIKTYLDPYPGRVSITGKRKG